MNKEDYFKYYIKGSEHYLIPKDVFDELFDEMSNWRDESKQLKDVIEEVREYIWSHKYEWGDLEEDNEDFDIDGKDILEILYKVW